MKLKVRVNPVAFADVQEAYISEDNPAAAERMGNDIYFKVEKLTEFPQMGTHLLQN